MERQKQVGFKLPITKCPKCDNNLQIWCSFGFKDMTDPDSIYGEVIGYEPCSKCGYKVRLRRPKLMMKQKHKKSRLKGMKTNELYYKHAKKHRAGVNL